ncbi:MAG: toll/interleukin-1 receptor domain-containing protein [Anaerolineae bacterium]|nr:toll/interleukin-1 receptor domain-containing protein [Anaerolineae bacterium]
MDAPEDCILRVFISYSRADIAIVGPLQHHIRELGVVREFNPDIRLVDVWYDQLSIQVGRSWREQLEQGLLNADVLCLFMSTESIRSQYVRDEVESAWAQQKTVIPLLCKQVEDTQLNPEAQAFHARVRPIQRITLTGITPQLSHPNMAVIDSTIEIEWHNKIELLRKQCSNFDEERKLIKVLCKIDHRWVAAYFGERVRSLMQHFDATHAQYYVGALASKSNAEAQRILATLQEWWDAEINPAYTGLLKRAVQHPLCD